MSSNKTHPWTFKASWWFLPITYLLLFLLLMPPQCWISSHPPGLAEPLPQFQTQTGTFQRLYMWAEQRDLIHNTRTSKSLRQATSSPKGLSQSCGNWIDFLNSSLTTDPLPCVEGVLLNSSPLKSSCQHLLVLLWPRQRGISALQTGSPSPCQVLLFVFKYSLFPQITVRGTNFNL